MMMDRILQEERAARRVRRLDILLFVLDAICYLVLIAGIFAGLLSL